MHIPGYACFPTSPEPKYQTQEVVLSTALVLVQCGIELILFLVASTELCFGFRLGRMLITDMSAAAEQSSESKTLQILMLPENESWGCTGSLRGCTARIAHPKHQKDIPYHTMSCSVTE